MTEEAWRARLRARGHRITPQREAVARAVAELPHASAESVHAHLRSDDPDLSLSTVYRNLTVLQELGVIEHTHLGTTSVYHLVGEDPHIHLSCLRCHAVRSVPADVADDFAAQVAELTGFQLDATHSAVHGLCAECAAH
ncbi:MAG: Fur family transcriptional regulator [Candidatus Nanopelagicales bacterium]